MSALDYCLHTSQSFPGASDHESLDHREQMSKLYTSHNTTHSPCQIQQMAQGITPMAMRNAENASFDDYLESLEITGLSQEPRLAGRTYHTSWPVEVKSHNHLPAL